MSDKHVIKTVYLLENLGCAHCAAKMEERIQALPEVEEATLTFTTKQLRVTAEHPEELLPKIQQICASIEPEVRVFPREGHGHHHEHVHHGHEEEHHHHHEHGEDCCCGHHHEHEEEHHHHHEHGEDCCCGHHHEHEEHHHHHEHEHAHGEEKQELSRIFIGAFLFLLGIALEKLGLGNLFSFLVFLAAYLILGLDVLKNAFQNIGHGQFLDENFLMAVATLGAFAIQDYAEAVGVMLFYCIGEYFEHAAVEKSRSQIMDAVDLRPETVNLLQGEDLVSLPAEAAKVGDVLLIRPGDRIPLDGKILEGESRLDTSALTGEPVPVSVQAGDSILSGCVNTSGQLKLLVEKPLSESMVSRILDSVENAAASKPKIDRFITRFSKVYTPCVVFLALAVAILPSLVSGNWHYWIYTALSFLVMSCPCALVLSVPLAFFSGIGAGSKKGILFKGGASMEALSQVRAVVMDKTGTLTEGNFKLQEIVPVADKKEEELLRLCASCEQHSTHPIAHSIVHAAQEKNLYLEVPESLSELSGYGITAVLAEGELLCGNRKLMEKYEVSLSDVPEQLPGAEVFLAINGTLAGYFLISDTLKSDAKSAVNQLKKLGLRTVMLTGDSLESAQEVAQVTGMDEVYAKLLPDDKLALLKKIRQESGSVMFVGDGINDAPVLAGADVGAAMGSGADAAIEAADAVFMTSTAAAIPESIAIARSANRIALENVIFALAIKIAVMLLGLFGHANMWMAVFADSGVAMLCVLNSIRILYRKK